MKQMAVIISLVEFLLVVTTSHRIWPHNINLTLMYQPIVKNHGIFTEPDQLYYHQYSGPSYS